MNQEKKAEQDLWQMTKELSRANKRKATVPWAFPTEVAQMITSPLYFSKPEHQRHGLGYGESLEGLQVPKLQERMNKIMVHVRRSRAGPMDAHHSFTWQVDNKNGMPRTRGIRLLRGFDGMWRCYYRGIRRRGRKLELPSYACGCRNKHRREAAVMAARITSWGLVKAGL